MFLITVVSCMLILPYKYIVETYMNNPDSMLRSRQSLKIREKNLLENNSFGANDFTNFNIYHANSIFLTNYVTMGKKYIHRRYSLQHCFMSTYSSYIGFITLALCLIALFKPKKNKYFYFWLFSGIIFLILSLGPFMRLSVNMPLYGPGKMSFIYKIFYRYFPFFNNIRIPQRFNLCVLLCTGIIAGIGICYLTENMKLCHGNMLSLLICLTLITEVTLLAPTPFPVELNHLKVPQIYRSMAKEKNIYGVVESPIKKYKQGLYYQTLHGKGSLLSVNDFVPDLVSGNLFLHCVYSLERGFDLSPYVYSEKRLWKHLGDLREKKIKYIIVYNNVLGERKTKVNQFLRYFLGEPEKSGNDVYIYRLFKDERRCINKEIDLQHNSFSIPIDTKELKR